MVIRDGVACIPQIPMFYLRARDAVIPDGTCAPDLCAIYVGVSLEWRGEELFHWDPDTGWSYLATSDGARFIRREQCFGTALLFRFEHTDDAALNAAQRRFREYDGPVY